MGSDLNHLEVRIGGSFSNRYVFPDGELLNLSRMLLAFERAGFESIERKEWVPAEHAHRHFKTFGTEPDGDEVNAEDELEDEMMRICHRGEIEAALDEAFRIGREAHVPVNTFHLKVGGAMKGHMSEVVAKIESARKTLPLLDVWEREVTYA